MKASLICLFVMFPFFYSEAQTIKFQGHDFEAVNVTASVTKINGKKAIKVERDLNALPFDMERLGATVDEPTYVKLKNVSLDNGIIEVKVLSRIQENTPFPGSQGFIGVAFRINEDNSAYESFYLRPRVGRSDNQFARNHAVQYYAYPDHKFDKLRQDSRAAFETSAPVALDEWITLRIEIKGEMAKLYINNQKYDTMVVTKMLGKTKSGSVGLWVDIGTEGYFRDLKIKE